MKEDCDVQNNATGAVLQSYRLDFFVPSSTA